MKWPYSRRVGARGEMFVANYLFWNGFSLLTARYLVHGHGELDLVVRKGDTVSIVEVKTRSTFDPRFPAAGAVDDAKKAHLIAAARVFVRAAVRKGYMRPSDKLRFDVAEVYLDEDFRSAEINYIQDAFLADIVIPSS